MNLLNRRILNAVSRRFTLLVSRRNCASLLPDKVEEDKTLDDDYDVNGQLIQKKVESSSSDAKTETITHATEISPKPKSSSLNLMSLLEKGDAAETPSWHNKPPSLKLMSLLEKSAYENLDDNAPFENFLRHSKFVQLGDPLGRIVVGKIAHVHKDNLYIDFGGKFNCVCKKPLFNPEQYAAGTTVRLKLQDLELSSRFLGSDKDMTLLEADATLVGLHRNDFL